VKITTIMQIIFLSQAYNQIENLRKIRKKYKTKKRRVVQGLNPTLDEAECYCLF
jgi:hypothetical protein